MKGPPKIEENTLVDGDCTLLYHLNDTYRFWDVVFSSILDGFPIPEVFIHQSHGIFFGHQKFHWSHPSTEESNFTLCSAVGLWLVVSGFPVSIPYRIHTAYIGGKDSSIWMGTFPKCLVIWGMTSDVPSLQSDLFLLPRCPRLVKINKI